MKVLVTWVFDADVEDIDPSQVDVVGLAKDLAENEVASLLSENKLMAADFEYLTGEDIKKALEERRES